jgi:hypothetical protein
VALAYLAWAVAATDAADEGSRVLA